MEIHLDAITVEDGLPQGYVQAMAQDSTGYLLVRDPDGWHAVMDTPHGVPGTMSRTPTALAVTTSAACWWTEGYPRVGYAPFDWTGKIPVRPFSRIRVEGLEDGLSSRLQSRLCADGLGRTRISLHTSQGWRNPVVDPERWAQLGRRIPAVCHQYWFPLVDARVFIGPNHFHPCIANPDTFQLQIHRSADGFLSQVIDRPHKASRVAPRTVCVERRKWWPIPLPDTCSSPEPGFVTPVHDQAAPLDTIHLTDQQFQLFLLLDSQRRIWGGPHNGTASALDPKSGRTEVVTPSGSVPAGIWQTTGLRPTFDDRAGNVWFTTGGFGVFRTNLRRERFTPWTPGY
ncbi:MAG: hypothetical protein IPN38_19165 [Flavobacteriales bacterium]|nr:hypothetical protein [Flavobacteriales bacterium]